MSARPFLLALVLALSACGARTELRVEAIEEGPDVDVPIPPERQLVAGYNHTCFLENRRVRCWGAGAHSQLGVNGSPITATPVEVPVVDVVQIAAGQSSTLMLTSDRRVLYVGEDLIDARRPPIPVPRLIASDGAQLFPHGAGRHHCFRARAGALRCFGDNTYGQQTATGSTGMVARAIPAFASARELSIGDGFTCGWFETDVRCVGRNETGQLGDGTLVSRSELAPAIGVGRVWHLGTGVRHACANTTFNHVLCWGANEKSQLGDGLRETRSTPFEIGLIDEAKEILGGEAHTCALFISGRYSCWGGDVYTTPFWLSEIDDAVELAVGAHHTCVLRKNDNSVWCSGSNGVGQLGDGTLADSAKLVRVKM